MALEEAQRIELRSDLQTLAEELTESLRESSDAAKPVALDQTAVGRVSRIDAIGQQKMVEAGRQALQTRLQQARAALARFEQNEYGECATCGEEIAYKRLKARPEAPFCLACQNARERRE